MGWIRFLNSVNINWTRFTLLLAERVVNGKLVLNNLMICADGSEIGRAQYPVPGAGSARNE